VGGYANWRAQGLRNRSSVREASCVATSFQVGGGDPARAPGMGALAGAHCWSKLDGPEIMTRGKFTSLAEVAYLGQSSRKTRLLPLRHAEISRKAVLICRR